MKSRFNNLLHLHFRSRFQYQWRVGARQAAVYCIRAYQSTASMRPRVCRYHPSCSEYAAQCIAKHTAYSRASALGIRRILRCNPFSVGGYDPGSGISVRRGELRNSIEPLGNAADEANLPPDAQRLALFLCLRAFFVPSLFWKHIKENLLKLAVRIPVS